MMLHGYVQSALSTAGNVNLSSNSWNYFSYYFLHWLSILCVDLFIPFCFFKVPFNLLMLLPIGWFVLVILMTWIIVLFFLLGGFFFLFFLVAFYIFIQSCFLMSFCIDCCLDFSLLLLSSFSCVGTTMSQFRSSCS